ncbi:hypothetical protein HID58_051531, partial [Brassica napus]
SPSSDISSSDATVAPSAVSHSKFEALPHATSQFIVFHTYILSGNTLACTGNLYLTSTPSTKFYYDTNIPAIKEFTSRLRLILSWLEIIFKSWEMQHQRFPCVDTMEEIKKKELV